MLKREDFANISDFDSAFDSEIFEESELSLSLTSDNDFLSESGEKVEFRLSTASDFDFEIFSESGKILRDFQMTSMAEQFPDISFVEEEESFESDSSRLNLTSLTEEEKISNFAFRLLHSEY
ncbi:hypothetical protein OfM1_01170 [Lactovum odontotermitis]